MTYPEKPVRESMSEPAKHRRPVSRGLGDLLVADGLITQDQLQRALQEQKNSNEKLGSILVRLGMLHEDQYIGFLSRQYGIPSITLSDLEIDPEVVKLVPPHVAKKYEVLPVKRQSDILTLAMADPTNVFALDDVAFLTNLQMMPVVASQAAIWKAIDKFYDKGMGSIVTSLQAQRRYLEELLRQLATLAERCAALGGSLLQAANELNASGTLPPEQLVDEIACVRRDFVALHARGLEVAQSLPAATPLLPGDIGSLRDLDTWLRSFVDAVEAEERQVATEHLRSRALTVLNRVLALAHRDGIDFPPLQDCQAKVRDLARTIAEAPCEDLPPETEALAEGKHPVVGLLTLVERREELDDEESELFRMSVAEAFGALLPVAAVRGKLRIQTGTPVTAEEAALPVEPLEPLPPPMAPEPLVVATSPTLAEHTGTQEVETQPATASPETSKELEVRKVEPGAEVRAQEPVAEAGEKELSQRREVGVVCVELRGYTEFAETRKPDEVLAAFTEYYNEVGKLILGHEGTLHAVTGSTMSVLFDPLPGQAENAIRMAVEMQARMAEMTVKWGKRGYKLGFSISIAQGSATIDLEGRPNSEDIDAMVTLAERLSQAAKPGQIVVSPTFLAMVQALVEVVPEREGGFFGRERPVTAYTILGLKGQVPGQPRR